MPISVTAEPDLVAFEECLAMTMASVPEVYLDGWARLQLQRPPGVTEARWRQVAGEPGAPGDLFDAPPDGKLGGLVWFLAGETVRALGPEHAVTEAGQVFDRLENNQGKSHAAPA